MTKSYTGGHPLESVVADIAKERDAALARAEAAERHIAELEEQLARCLATDHARFYHLWQARAEAAERRVAELEASREHFQMLWVSDGCKYAQFADDLVAALKIELPDEYEDDEDGTLAVIVAKVAELEARLAELEWRPVDWDNMPTGQVWLYDRVMGCHQGEWDGEHWKTASRQLIVASHWRPLPPPPAATENKSSDSLRRAIEDVNAGRIHPTGELWDGIDAEPTATE